MTLAGNKPETNIAELLSASNLCIGSDTLKAIHSLPRSEKRSLIRPFSRIALGDESYIKRALRPLFSFQDQDRRTRYGGIIRKRTTVVIKMINDVIHILHVSSNKHIRKEKNGFWIANNDHIAIWVLRGLLFFVSRRFVAKMTKAATKFVWSFEHKRPLTHREMDVFVLNIEP